MERDFEEQEARIELLRAQKEESVARAAFYQKMAAYYEKATPTSGAPQYSFLVDPAAIEPLGNNEF